MTHVDSEPPPPVCHLGDRRIACETLADELRDQDIPESTIVNYAPESFWLSKDAEFDWFDRNAFLDRKESIKGNSNSVNLNPIVVNPNANASSLQISAFLKSKAALKTNNIESKRRNCKLTNILLFPKRSDSIGKEPAALSMTEPSSPKVSCLGRVRSKNCPRRRKAKRAAGELEKPVTQREKTGQIRKTGFMCCIRSLLQSGCYGGWNSNKSLPEINKPSEYSVTRSNNARLCPDGRPEGRRDVD